MPHALLRRPSSQAVRSTGTRNYLIASASLLPCRHCDVTVTSLAGRQPLPHWPSRRPRGIFLSLRFLFVCFLVYLSLSKVAVSWKIRLVTRKCAFRYWVATDCRVCVCVCVYVCVCVCVCRWALVYQSALLHFSFGFLAFFFFHFWLLPAYVRFHLCYVLHSPANTQTAKSVGHFYLNCKTWKG